MPLYVVLHCCDINGGQEIMRSQLNKIKEHGLYDQVESIHVSWLSPNNSSGPDFLGDFSKVKIGYASTQINQEEYPALDLVCKLAREHCDSFILYMHSKGVRYTGTKREFANDWRNLMEYFVVNQWRSCIKYLEDKCAVGVNHATFPSPHFSGNFWWARANHIKRCAQNLMSNKASFMTTRYYCEQWLFRDASNRSFSQSQMPVVCLWKSETDHYNNPYPASSYVSRGDRVTFVGVPGVENGRTSRHQIGMTVKRTTFAPAKIIRSSGRAKTPGYFRGAVATPNRPKRRSRSVAR